VRKWPIGLGAALSLAAAFFAFAPGVVERGQNRVVAVTLKVEPRGRSLHETLTIADLHADTLLWDRDLLTRADRGQVDLPRPRTLDMSFEPAFVGIYHELRSAIGEVRAA